MSKPSKRAKPTDVIPDDFVWIPGPCSERENIFIHTFRGRSKSRKT